MLVIVPPVVPVLVVTAVATLSLSSISNMIQTLRVVQQDTPYEQPELATDSAAVVMEQLREKNRGDFLLLFASNRTVELGHGLDQAQGRWKGVLLDNNGPVLTRVSRLLTNVLFGRGQKWTGKTIQGQVGMNRFLCSQENEVTLHRFDCTIEPSRLRKETSSSVFLRYKAYETFANEGWRSIFWRSMVDELRLVQCDNGERVFLGIGSMAWSGGVWNGAPFCLCPDDDPTLN